MKEFFFPTQSAWSKFADSINGHYTEDVFTPEITVAWGKWWLHWKYERTNRTPSGIKINLPLYNRYLIDVSVHCLNNKDLTFSVTKNGAWAKYLPKKWLSNNSLPTKSSLFNEKFFLMGNPKKLAIELFSKNKVKRSLLNMTTFKSLNTLTSRQFGFEFNLCLETFNHHFVTDQFTLHASHTLATTIATEIENLTDIKS